ncbi:LOW QUALITY PROTEIN: hypothetical protein RJ641_035407 [Dillenia turbinata]|uniref:CAF17 C-terminal domain-containing protein n=1 Tax=Dillenia turbinata TaxID=194707 RepID=A0AAN8ZEW7_9MAGN
MHRLRTPLQLHNRHQVPPFSNKPTEPHFENVGSMASQLKSRSVLRLRGPDTVKFLQGVLTNDVTKFSDPNGEKTSNLSTPNVPIASIPLAYSAMLNPQGRFLYDMFVYRPPRADARLNETGSGPGSDPNEDLELLLDVDGTVVHELLQTLKKYRLRSKIEIENMSYLVGSTMVKTLHENSSVKEPEAASVGWDASVDCSAMSASKGNNVGWQWFKDPRLDCLAPLVEADKKQMRDYFLWIIEKEVAEGSTEMPKEIEPKVAPGSEVIDTSSGKKAGIVATALGCCGLGLLRLHEAFKGSGGLTIGGQEGVKVEAYRPKWWPPEWFKEQQQHGAAA